MTWAADGSTIRALRAPLANAEHCMRRRTAKRWIACLLAPAILIAGATPPAATACSTSRVAQQPKACCGCCQAAHKQAKQSAATERACCAKTVAVKPKCCCQKTPSAPVAPLPVQNDGPKLVKESPVSHQTWVFAQPAPEVATGPACESSCQDEAGPPLRVRFCVWLI